MPYPQQPLSSLREMVSEQERTLGPSAVATLASRHNLAVAYNNAGNPDRSTTLLEEVLAAQERVLGPHHPDTLLTRYVLTVARRKAR